MHITLSFESVNNKIRILFFYFRYLWPVLSEDIHVVLHGVAFLGVESRLDALLVQGHQL